MGENKMIYLAIDNGISGSVGWVNESGSSSGVFSMPTFSEQDYVQKKQNVTRIDTEVLSQKLKDLVVEALTVSDFNKSSVRLFLERPLVNPMRYRATLSAIRAWEATLIVLRPFKWSYIVVDSRKWQKAMLPTGCKGPELKVASVQVGCRLFPDHADWIKDQGDADSLLIAEFARRNKL
jgi:hypothetical protein